VRRLLPAFAILAATLWMGHPHSDSTFASASLPLVTCYTVDAGVPGHPQEVTICPPVTR
jgi:hypothetical protein